MSKQSSVENLTSDLWFLWIFMGYEDKQQEHAKLSFAQGQKYVAPNENLTHKQ